MKKGLRRDKLMSSDSVLENENDDLSSMRSGGGSRTVWDFSPPGEEHECTSSASSRESSPIRRGSIDFNLHKKLHMGLGATPPHPPTISSPTAKDASVGHTNEKGKPEDGKIPSEMDMMKERFAKLLLGEDMSGGGKGVCTALAISNAITNLSASVFGELKKLEPLSKERIMKWRREMDWLLSVSDYIVEFVPSRQTAADGTVKEIMVTQPRSDLHMNLPALRKLDAMLTASLESFQDTEFWYPSSKSSMMNEDDGNNTIGRQEGNWWVPIPIVPAHGLSESARKHLQNQKDCLGQVLKASLAINGQVLSEMEVPAKYLENLPKKCRKHLGETVYFAITAEQYSPDLVLANIDTSDNFKVENFFNKLEDSIHIWRQKSKEAKLNNRTVTWTLTNTNTVAEIEKWELSADRAESLLMMLRHRFPGVAQTTLDGMKIEQNKDVGQAILEGYARVLESLAYNVISRIDAVIRADDTTKCNQQALSRNTSISSTGSSSFHGSQNSISLKQINLVKSSSTHSSWVDSPKKGGSLHWIGEKGMDPEFEISGKHPPPSSLITPGGHKSWSSMGKMNRQNSPPSRD